MAKNFLEKVLDIVIVFLIIIVRGVIALVDKIDALAEKKAKRLKKSQNK